MKCKCGNELFKIINKLDCSKCIHNGIYTKDGGYIHKENADKGLRNQVEDEGECELGISHGLGCYMFICSSCATKLNIPMVDI